MRQAPSSGLSNKSCGTGLCAVGLLGRAGARSASAVRVLWLLAWSPEGADFNPVTREDDRDVVEESMGRRPGSDGWVALVCLIGMFC